jgi:hypothetical protein
MPEKSRLEQLSKVLRNCISGSVEVASKIPEAIEGVQKAISMLPL